MTEYDIIHQSLCAYISQQNGVTEHKNHHLFQIAPTLLIHRKVSKYFWSDIVFTACYLINQIPSSVLQNQISYLVL